ncbi:MAG: signal peptidase I [Dethiobacteria bacterium]|jgi:signal peptidase I
MHKKLGNYLFIIIIAILVISPLATLLRQKPTLAVSIRTWSMVPVFTRGDLVFILPTGEHTGFSPGQIIVFRSEEDGIRDWTMHRIVEVDPGGGFITKGDANEETDQVGSHYPPVKAEWIAGVVPTIGPQPLKIPLLGYIPLLLEEKLQDPILLPVMLGVLAVVLLADEIFKSKKKRKKEALQKSQLYFFGGAAFAMLMGALMLMGSLFLTFPFGVEDNPGVLMGSSVGVLELGTSRELTLAELKNEGSIPSFYYAVSNDPQLTLQQNVFRLRKGDIAEVIAILNAEVPGIHQASVYIGMFMPFLPFAVIRFLADINLWLAFVVVSLVPALPLMALPYLEPRQRKRLVKVWRKKISRIAELISR